MMLKRADSIAEILGWHKKQRPAYIGDIWVDAHGVFKAFVADWYPQHNIGDAMLALMEWRKLGPEREWSFGETSGGFHCLLWDYIGDEACEIQGRADKDCEAIYSALEEWNDAQPD